MQNCTNLGSQQAGALLSYARQRITHNPVKGSRQDPVACFLMVSLISRDDEHPCSAEKQNQKTLLVVMFISSILAVGFSGHERRIPDALKDLLCTLRNKILQ